MKIIVVLVAVVAAQATDLPQLKEGLWSVRNQTVNSPGSKKNDATYVLCRNHAFDQRAQSMAKGIKGCAVSKESLTGGKYYAETHCTFGKTTVDTKGTTTYTSATTFRSESHTTFSPALNGMTESSMVIEQKYLGSCPVDLLPGDRKGPDGKVIHAGQR